METFLACPQLIQPYKGTRRTKRSKGSFNKTTPVISHPDVIYCTENPNANHFAIVPAF